MIRFFKNNFHYFFNAWVLFTRFPAPQFVSFNHKYQQKAIIYFPFTGLILGFIVATVFWCFNLFLSIELAVILSLLISVLITGGLHEDGLADFFDGFGAGGDKEKILSVMKDSATGVYGVLGLTGFSLIKIFSLINSNTYYLPLILIAGYASSRFFSLTPLFFMKYINKEGSKVSHYTKPLSYYSLLFPLICSLIPFVFLDKKYLIILPFLLIITVLFNLYVKKKTGGYTGDCLGALQQITETVFYLFTSSTIWNYI